MGDDKENSYYKGFGVPREALWAAARATAGCVVLHLAADQVLRIVVPARALARLAPGDRLFLPEKFVDIAHAAYVGLGALDLIFVKKTFDRDCFRPYPRQCDDLFASALGFVLYDMGVMYVHGKEPASMWAHHVVQAYGTFLMMGFRHGAFFPMMFCITELTIVPNNLLWLVQKLAGKGEADGLSRALMYLRVVFFLLFRTFVAPYTLYYAVQRGRLAEHLRKTHPVVSIASSLNMAALGSLNVMWTLAMIKSVRRVAGKPLAGRAADVLTQRH